MVKIATKSLALFVCALFAFALLSCGGGGGGGGGSASSGPWGGKTTITIPFTKGGTSRAGFSKGFNDLNWDAIELTVTQIANGKSEVVYEDMITAEKNITVEVVTGSRIEATAIITMKEGAGDPRTATGVIEKVEPGKNTLTVYVPYKCTLLNEDNEVVDVILYNARDGLVLQNLSDDELLVSKYTDLATDVEYNVGTVTGINGDKRFRLSTAEKYPFLLGDAVGGGYSITAFDLDRTETVIKIPATINGTPVTAIAPNAFKDCTQITKVELPEGLLTIGNNAFDGCSNLTTINLPADLTTLGKEAFNNCAALEGTITIPNGVTELKEAVFSGCERLSGINILGNVTLIENYVFRDCRNIAELTIPDSVTSLGTYGYEFENCVKLETITLSSVTALTQFTFTGCTGLKTINLPSVTAVDCSSFYNCTGLQAITFGTDNPPTVNTAGNWRFRLTGVKIHIPSSVDVDKNAWVDRFNSYFGTTLLDIIKDQ